MSVSAIKEGQQITTPAFRGKYKKTGQGNPYYYTNSAMKIGGTLAGLSVAGTLLELAGNKLQRDIYKNLPDEIKDSSIKIKSNKTAIILGGLAAIAIHLGCAAFIDSKRNQKAKETADYVKQTGTKNAVMNRDNIAISNKGRAYYDSETGAKYGAWLGAGAGVIGGIKALFKQKDTMKQLEAIGNEYAELN